MKQKGCALARVEDVALQPCSARKVFKPLMIEGDGGVDVGLPTLLRYIGESKKGEREWERTQAKGSATASNKSMIS